MTLTPRRSRNISTKRAHDTFHVATLTPDDFRDTRQRGVLGMVPGEIITTDNGYADHVDLEKDIP